MSKSLAYQNVSSPQSLAATSAVKRALIGASLAISLGLGGCEQLLGNPFDVTLRMRDGGAGRDAAAPDAQVEIDSVPKAGATGMTSNATRGQGAAGSGKGDGQTGSGVVPKLDAGIDRDAAVDESTVEPPDEEDAGAAGSVRELAAAPRCPMEEPSQVFSFTDSVDAWTGQKVKDYGSTTAVFERNDGSPKPGSVRVKYAFPQRPAEGALGANVGITGPPRKLSCVRARLKIDDSHPPPSDLTTEPASWYFWALSGGDWCFGQLLTPTQKGWYKQLDQTGVWYSLSAPLSMFGSDCAFDPTQIRSIGVGFASNFQEPWNAEFLVDRVELFED